MARVLKAPLRPHLQSPNFLVFFFSSQCFYHLPPAFFNTWIFGAKLLNILIACNRCHLYSNCLNFHWINTLKIMKEPFREISFASTSTFLPQMYCDSRTQGFTVLLSCQVNCQALQHLNTRFTTVLCNIYNRILNNHVLLTNII